MAGHRANKKKKRPLKPTSSRGYSRIRRADRATRHFLWEINYPHQIHPGLVPGVSIEDQRVRYKLDKPIFGVLGVLLVGFIAWGIVDTDQVASVSGAALTWTMENLGWVFSVLAITMVVFLIVLACSRYGRIPLGLDGEKPEYSTASWTAMLFAAGIGIGIIFFGPFEPITHYLNPRPESFDPGTAKAMKGAMAQAALHWGLNAWALYAVVGLAVAYVSYRRGRVPLMSSILVPLYGGKEGGPAARVIDGLAIIATLFGTACSLGIGALQIARGAEVVSGLSLAGNRIAIGIIVVLSIGTLISALSGVTRGIRRLSNINMVLSIGIALFFFVVGPTAFLLNVIPGVLSTYVGELPDMLALTMADGPEAQEFLTAQTTFYWAWWVSWAPFVGVFTAKISRGRTIRQFVFGVLFIPSTIIIMAFTILGGTTIYLQREYGSIAPDGTVDSLPAPEEVFFVVLDHLPGAGIVAPLITVVLAIFFITTADSASIVNSQLCQGGNPNPKRSVTAFWVLCMAGIAIVMLLVGGQDALTGLQNFIVVSALPFSVILAGMCIALVKELRGDPLAIRDRYARTALRMAVRQGIAKYGDNFQLDTSPVDPESGLGAGAGFDSTAEEITEWYQRTDEEGNPIDYDYGKDLERAHRAHLEGEDAGSEQSSGKDEDTESETDEAGGNEATESKDSE